MLLNLDRRISLFLITFVSHEDCNHTMTVSQKSKISFRMLRLDLKLHPNDLKFVFQ